jgi:hypothetical protein
MNIVKVDRRLPIHELNARRNRKRSLPRVPNPLPPASDRPRNPPITPKPSVPEVLPTSPEPV